MSDEHSEFLRNGNLRTPNAAVWLEIADHIDAQAAELAALRDELETERMRLAACSVAALSNTPEAVAQRIDGSNPYWSASYGDVCNIVDSEMALRARLAVVEGALSQYADPENWSCSDDEHDHRKGNCCLDVWCLDVWDMNANGYEVAQAALAKTAARKETDA